MTVSSRHMRAVLAACVTAATVQLLVFSQTEGPIVSGARLWSCVTSASARAAVFPTLPWSGGCPPVARVLWSTQARFRPLTVPLAPTNLSSIVSGSAITLTWSAPASGDVPISYLLETGSTAGAANLAQLDTASAVPSFTATSVPPGTYFLRLRARAASGTSAPSNEVTVIVGTSSCSQPPASPIGTTASVAGANVTLAWQGPSGSCGPTAYVIEAGSASGLSNLIVFSTGNAASTFSAAGVGAGTYFVRVRASNANGVSAPSNEVRFVVGLGPCTGPPAATSGLTASVSGSTVALQWTAGAGASTYVIEAGSTSGASNLVVSDLGSAATTLQATAGSGTYYVRVRARNACGIGIPSNEIVVTVGSTLGVPFDLRSNFNGIDDTVDPASPDSAIAVGNASVVLVRNQQIVIRNRAGELTASMALNSFLSSVRLTNEGLTDPHVIYDPGSSRFFVVSAGVGSYTSCTPGTCISHYLLAVSRTAVPTDLGSNSWYFFSLDRTRDNAVLTTNWGDFDHLGVTDEALVIASAKYSMLDGSPQGVKIRIVEKSRLIRGEAITSWTDITDLRDPVSGTRIDDRLLPATHLSHSSAFFLVSIGIRGDDGEPCRFVVWGMTNLLSTPGLSNKVADGGRCGTPPAAVQPGGGQAIDVFAFNSQPVYRNGSLWVASTISKDFGSGPVAAIYVTEIDVSHWPESVRTVQSSIIGEDRVWQFTPALMVDSSNNVGIVYARSGATEFASAYYSGRLAADPQNTLRTPRPLKTGASLVSRIENGRNRFTDYFGSASDPADDSIWMLGMYAKAQGVSGSWVGNMKLVPR